VIVSIAGSLVIIALIVYLIISRRKRRMAPAANDEAGVERNDAA